MVETLRDLGKTMRFLAILLAVATASSLVAEEEKRPVWIAAVGEPPVARLRVVEEFGFRGYKPDEIPERQLFPQDWSLAGENASEDFKLKLNHPARRLDLPRALRSCQLETGDKASLLSLKLSENPSLYILFNKDDTGEWKKGLSSLPVSLTRKSGQFARTTLVNLTPVPISYLKDDGKGGSLAPGQSLPVRIPQSAKTKTPSLPIVTQVGSKDVRLVVTDYHGSSSWLPVTIVRPASNTARPRLQGTVIYLN